MFEQEEVKADNQQRKRMTMMFGVLAALLVIGAFLIFANIKKEAEKPILDDALRAGTQQFDSYKDKVTLDKQEVVAAQNALEMVQFTVRGEIHNRGDRALNGVEIEALVIDLGDKIVSRRLGRPIPRSSQEMLAPGGKARFAITVDAPSKYKEADIKLVKAELHGLRFQ